ncbi:hypothetical protein KKF84_12495 [Myxococcota bacterium]|nr:hypothetical protein [Myxococcota bacterium]MBU1536135.1 hypothetical protein [Myxococcota bacterium]
MDFPPLCVSGSLVSTMESLLSPSQDAPLLIVGGKSLVRHFLLKGYRVDTAPVAGRSYGAIITMDSLPKKEPEALSFLVGLSSTLVAGAPLYIIEQSNPLTGRRGLLVRVLSLFGFLHTPEQLNRLFLKAGFTGISQRWPQGLRSLVVTWGTPHPLASSLHQILSLTRK